MVMIKAIAKRATKKSKEKVNAMKLFVKQSDESTYKVTIKNITHFESAMDHVSIAMSFRQRTIAIQQVKDHTKTAKLAGINDLMSVSTFGSWSPLLCRTFPTSSTTNMFGQSNWLATIARTVDSLYLIYACAPSTAVISRTFTWSPSPCLNATLPKTCSTWSSNFSTHCTACGAIS